MEDMEILRNYIDKRMFVVKKWMEKQSSETELMLFTGRYCELQKMKNSIEPLVNGNDISRDSWVNKL